MGAHITYDLPHALLEVGTDTDRLADYHRMNDLPASRTDAIQDAVTARYNTAIARFDRLAGPADEVFTNYWIRIGRSLAWYNAMRMQSANSREQAEGSIERSAFYLVESGRPVVTVADTTPSSAGVFGGRLHHRQRACSGARLQRHTQGHRHQPDVERE